ncbi:MAG: helix-turn-helix domain-containing protein, partial [Caldimonas sp.]
PGNVRQLENICHWLTVMAPAQLVDAKDLPPELQPKVVAALPAGAPVGASPGPAGAGAETFLRTAETAPVVTAHAGDEAATSASAPVLPGGAARSSDADWLSGLEREARELLQSGEPTVWETLTHRFEAQLIRTALEITRGRRIEAAQKLGIGRNTITRKIQELGLDDK